MFIILLITTPTTELYEYLKIIIVNDHVRHGLWCLSFIYVKMQIYSGMGVFLSSFTGLAVNFHLSKNETQTLLEICQLENRASS